MAALDYDLLSDCYDELYGGEQLKKYRCGVTKVDGFLSRVLDAGCGTGLFKDFLRNVNCFAEYVGVDLSAGMLNRARLRTDARSHFIQADAQHMPFRDKVFSHVFSFTVVHHLDPQLFFNECLRLATRAVVISQHKRLSPRLTAEAVVDDENVDEIIIHHLSPVLRQDAGSGF